MNGEIFKSWLRPTGSTYQRKMDIYRNVEMLLEEDNKSKILDYMFLNHNMGELLELLYLYLKEDFNENDGLPKIRVTIEQKEMLDNLFRVIKKR